MEKKAGFVWGWFGVFFYFEGS